jgi:hypothetical protein
VQPAAVGQFPQLPAQRLQLAPRPDIQPQYLADLPDRDRFAGLAHDGEDALVLRRERRLLNSRPASLPAV